MNLDKIQILGAGSEGHRLVEICNKEGIEVVAIGDDKELPYTFDSNIPVVIASHRLHRLNDFPKAIAFGQLQVLFPNKFSPHPFYKDLNNLPDLLWLHNRLQDDYSRETLGAVIAFRQTFDIERLKKVLNPSLYKFSFYSEDEIYVDGGAYDGDSVRWFIDRTFNKFKKIYAFEPGLTFGKLTENFIEDKRIKCICAGLYSKNGWLKFNNSERESKFGEGIYEVPIRTIDSLNDEITMIKMNIEGSEIEALKGAAKTIKEHLPKLAISVYHRPSDLWEIPKLINELSDDRYKLYLRQHDIGVIETVLYAIPK